MKSKLIPYVRIDKQFGHDFKLLNPTGRWKYKTNEFYKDAIYVEHKWFIFKFWIHESNIHFGRERTEEIHDCKE